jgi:predicted RNase H-like HicB family nuclease
MSAKSKCSSVKRPFAPAVLNRARALAAEYQVILAHEEGHWYGRGLELPLVFGDGPTPQACIDDVREALTGAVGYLLERGKRPPSPAKLKKRTTQVNIRLTADEKALLEGIARGRGFAGLSDFIRDAALAKAES